jgi:hypothetical protein
MSHPNPLPGRALQSCLPPPRGESKGARIYEDDIFSSRPRGPLSRDLREIGECRSNRSFPTGSQSFRHIGEIYSDRGTPRRPSIPNSKSQIAKSKFRILGCRSRNLNPKSRIPNCRLQIPDCDFEVRIPNYELENTERFQSAIRNWRSANSKSEFADYKLQSANWHPFVFPISRLVDGKFKMCSLV